jgi:G3E family GTPase
MEYSQKHTRIVVLTGFFGSGKTTLIKHLIKTSEKKIGIIENDLAELNIDGKILNLSDSAIEVISNACICCTGNKHLTQSIDMLMSTHSNLEYIFIETTGLANPIKLRDSVVHASIKHNLDYIGTICIVDAKNALNRTDIEEQLVQIAYSDYILISKVDLIDEPIYSTIVNYIKDTNSQAIYDKIIMGRYSIEQIEQFVLDNKQSNIYQSHHIEHSHSHEHIHSSISSISFTCNFMRPFNDADENIFDILKDIINKNAIFRSKGIIKFQYENQLTIFHGVEKDFEIEDVKVNTLVYNNNISSVVFIGKGLDKTYIINKLEEFKLN